MTTIEELASSLKGSGALMALDLGSKTIGLAISDTTRRFASPLGLIERRKFTQDVEDLKKYIGERSPVALILGLPLNMDGTEGPRAQSTRAFARNLLPLTEIPIIFWDERLSTLSAERVMLEADMSRAKRAEKIDAAAAAVILQSALDRLRFIEQNG